MEIQRTSRTIAQQYRARFVYSNELDDFYSSSVQITTEGVDNSTGKIVIYKMPCEVRFVDKHRDWKTLAAPITVKEFEKAKNFTAYLVVIVQRRNDRITAIWMWDGREEWKKASQLKLEMHRLMRNNKLKEFSELMYQSDFHVGDFARELRDCAENLVKRRKEYMQNVTERLKKYYKRFDKLDSQYTQSNCIDDLKSVRTKFRDLYLEIGDKFEMADDVAQILAEIEGEIEAIDYELKLHNSDNEE